MESVFFIVLFLKKSIDFRIKNIYTTCLIQKNKCHGKKPNHQKLSDETYQERYFLFLREQLVRLDKEFKSSFEKTKELRKRYQEAINDKSFVGKELTELQRTYEALEEVTNLSREILRELKIKDRILNHDPETII